MNNFDDSNLSKENTDDSRNKRATKLNNSVPSVSLLDATYLGIHFIEIVDVVALEFFVISATFLHSHMSFNQNLQHFWIVMNPSFMLSLKFN